MSNPFQRFSERTVTLPVTKFSVTLRVPTTAEAYDFSKYQDLPKDQQAERTKEFLYSLIVSWDATDDDKKAVPLSSEAYYQLPAKDGLFLAQEALKDIVEKSDVAINDPKGS